MGWSEITVLAVGAAFLVTVLLPLALADPVRDPVAGDTRTSAPFSQDNLWPGEDHDYAVWVAGDGSPMAGRRARGGEAWETIDLGKLPGNPLEAPTADDEHNVYAIAEGPDGRVHVIGNMHNDPLRYVRTTGHLQFTDWEAAEVAGPTDQVTYPRFVRRAGGELLFFRREGKAGLGDTLLDVLGEDGQWSHVGVVVDGTDSEESPYLNRIAYDPEPIEST